MLTENRVQKYTMGSLHTHAANYKIDLDVGGTANSFETLQVRATGHIWCRRISSIMLITMHIQQSI
jgi:Cu2+-containing amine oxidase